MGRGRGIAGRAATGACAALLAAALALGTPARTSAGPVPGPSPKGPPFWAADFMAGAVRVTRERAVLQARAFDLIVALRGTYRDHVAAMKAANPDLVLLVYLNGTFAQSSQGSAYPDGWYARDASGEKVRSLGFGNYLMRPDEPGWVADVVARCRRFLEESGYDGCFLDMLGAAPLHPGYATGLPVNPATGAVWTRADWLVATSGIAEAVRRAVAPRPVFGNGLGSGGLYFAPVAPSRVLLGPLGGAMAERFVRDPTDPADRRRPEERWLRDVRLVADAAARGRTALAMTKVWVPAGARDLEAWRTYALATFLLGYEPGHGYFSFRADHGLTDPSIAGGPDLGAPLGAYREAGGAYLRAFERGLVLVNPGSATVRVPVAARYRPGRSRGFVTLRPHSAAILSRT